MRRLAISVLRISAVLVALGLLLFASVAIVLNTETGTRWAIARIDSRLPGELQVDSFTGTLWRGLHIQSLSYRDESQVVKLESIDLRIRWSDVASGRLPLQSLHVKAFSRTSLAPAPAEPQPLEVSMSPLPIGIVVEKGSFGEFKLASAGGDREFADLRFENLRIVGSRIRLRSISGNYQTVKASFSRLSITLEGDVAITADTEWGIRDGEWRGQGSVKGSLADLQFEQLVDGPYPASVNGQVRLLAEIEPVFDAHIEWNDWLAGERRLPQGTLHLVGPLSNYDTQYEFLIDLGHETPYAVRGSGRGNLDALAGFHAELAGTAGTATMSGAVAWQPEVSASADVNISRLDPGAFREDLAGELAATARVQVSGGDEVAVNDLTVTGELNNAAVTASGNILLTDDVRRCRACVLNVGENRIDVDGEISADRMNLAMKLRAPKLGQLVPGLGGSAIGTGDVSGTLQSPVYGATVELTEFSNAGVAYGGGTIFGRGKPDAFSISVDWQYRGISVDARGSMQLVDEVINGVVRTASVFEEQAGRWTLDEPVTLRIANRSTNIGAHRWSGNNGEVRVSRFLLADDGASIVASIDQVPLSLGNAFLPPNFSLRGTGNADLNIVREADQWAGQVNWAQTGTVLRVLEPNGDVTEVSVPQAEVNATFRDGGAQARAVLAIDPGVQGELDLDVETLAVDSPMQGRLRLQGDTWEWVSAAVPQIDRFEGSISASIDASGPLNAPAFAGNVEWHDGRLTVPAANVPLKDINVVITGAAAGDASITGSATAGSGNLELEGDIRNVMQASRRISLAISGSGAELVNWPEYRIWGSPDISLVGTSDGWTIGGKLAVPKAEIALREAPVGAVTLSPDVHVLGEEEEVEKATRIVGETRLLLGDRVQFNALGLDTRLTGDVLLRMRDNRPISAEGKLSLVDGTFGAHGQKLAIEKGELTFTGPIDDPLVDVRAVRVIETFEGTVKAGIHLRGRARDLTTTVYSEPSMGDADALSYLVIGRPLNQATESDGGELSGAAVALGLRQAARITDQVGQALGLDQLSLAGDGGDSTALVAGKQINSRLYARYAYGVFSRLGSLLIRYRMSRRLTLEAGAGENQSIDIVYTIEK